MHSDCTSSYEMTHSVGFTDSGGTAIRSFHLQWEAGTTRIIWSDLTVFALNILKTGFLETSDI